MTDSVLFIGCGDISQRVAPFFSQYRLFGVRRTIEALPNNIIGLRADLISDDLVEVFSSLPQKISYVVITMTPEVRGKKGYEAAYISAPKRALDALNQLGISIEKILFLSSTSVYGQDGGEWVDETSPTVPVSETAKVLLRAEKLIFERGIPTIIVRSSGIYGPGRDRFLKETLSGNWFKGTPLRYSNRIHQDDLAAAIAWLLSLENSENCYIVSDSEPETLFNIQSWIGETLNLKFENRDKNPYTRAGSKRLSNKRLLSTGFRLAYPNYKAGYSSMFDA